MDRNVDVVVVGGGPAGMTVAGDLARLGRSVAVVEKWPTINPSSRAFATMARTLELLDARGLADQLLATSTTTPGINLFKGAKLDLTHLRSRYRYAMITPQTNVDQALELYAKDQGADIHRGIALVDLVQDDAGVTLTARAKDDDNPSSTMTWRAKYVVGADGAHSKVRGLVGMDFPGKSVLSSVVLADVKLTAGPHDGGLTLGDTPREFGFLAPYGKEESDGAWYRSMTWDRQRQVPDSDPVGEAEIVDSLNRAMGRDVGVVDVGWHSRFHCDERQVRDYRSGRVFLVGDAAHVHSPMGAQGMNTGIQDGVNLAWKLGAVLAGADDSILDTYHRERHPIGKQVVRRSGLMMRAVTLHPRPVRFMRDRLAAHILSIPKVRDLVAGSFAGTELRYPPPDGQSDLVGTRATEVPLHEGRLTELQRLPGFALIRERANTSTMQKPGPDLLVEAQRMDDGPSLLVRPDGYVAWAGSSTSRSGDEGWPAALSRWTGAR
ncbi:FAD-dependent monooxygenase [Rhodococcus globerulus]|uniref:FAD-dependent monooxygenase n=1 Tax=Rhodococcus globerulus TaxID=33008 RepID=UPI0039EA3837